MIELNLLGPVSIRRDGRECGSVLAQPKRMALLAYLSVVRDRGPEARDRLLALFWPEASEKQARNALNQALHFLRRSLGDAVQSLGSGALRLSDVVVADIDAFRGYLARGDHAGAMRVYRGDFMEGLHASHSPDLERWVDEQRARFRDLASGAACACLESAALDGDVARVAAVGRRAMELSPYDETVLRRVLEALEAVGDRAGALALYRSFETKLAADLEVAPEAETVAIVQRLRQAQPAAAGQAGPSAPGDPSAVRVAEAGGLSSVAGPTVRPPGYRRRTPRAVALVVVPTALALGAVVAASHRSHEPGVAAGRVLVLPFQNRTGDPTLDPLEGAVADRIADDLSASGLGRPETGPVMPGPSDGTDRSVRRLARRAGADVVVWGALDPDGDSVRIEARVAGLTGPWIVRRTRPFSVPRDRVAGAAEVLRERALGEIAALRDTRFSGLVEGLDVVPTFAAYRELMAGMDEFTADNYQGAIPHFRRALELDPDATVVLEWLQWSTGNAGAPPEERAAVLRDWQDARPRLSPVEQLRLDFFLLGDSASLDRRFEVARRAADLAPRSAWPFVAGRMSLRMDRPREAVDYFGRLDPARDWVGGWTTFWDIESAAYDALEDHAGAVRRIRDARRVSPLNMVLAWLEATEWASLGRERELEDVIQEAEKLPPRVYNGKTYTAGSVLDAVCYGVRASRNDALTASYCGRALAWMDRHPDLSDTDERFEVLYSLGRWDAARSIADSLVASDSTRLMNVWRYAVVAARCRDDERLARARTLLDQKFPLSSPWDEVIPQGIRARMAAILGDKDEAVRLIQERFARGLPWGFTAWEDIDFENLRGYPPFEELRKPRG